MIKFNFMLMACLAFAGVLFAEDAQIVTQDILSKTVDRSIAILSDQNSSTEQKQASFDVLLQEVCQSDLMAKLVLGRDGWSAFSEDQRQDFIETFIQVLTRSYYNKMAMADISAVKVSFAGNEELSPQKRRLKTVIEDSVDGYHVDYMFALIEGRWGIYDMSIDGISLLTSYRTQFADYLKQHTAQELLDMLKAKEAN